MAEDKTLAEKPSDKPGSVPDWLKNMPKSDLHCHLGGSIRPATMLELADEYGIRLPAKDEAGLREHIHFKNKPVKSLAAYLDCIKLCESVFVRPDAFDRVAFEVCHDANKEGVNLLELRFGPTNYVNDNQNLYQIVEATINGLKRGAEKFKMHTGLIICGIRTDKVATKEAVEMVMNYYGKGVVGMDLAGQENGFRPNLFEKIYRPISSNLVSTTVHAGEEDDSNSIEEAIDHLRAKRIGHGLSLRGNTTAWEYVDRHRIGLEMCVSSNVDTGSITSFQTHPIRTYYKNGLRVFVNTDNRTVSDTNITKEYLLLMKHLDFNQSDIYRLAEHGIKASFTNSKTVRSLLCELEDYKLKNPAPK